MVMTLVRTAAWLSLLAIFVMTVGPIGLRPISPAPVQIERFTAFLLVGGLFGAGYPKRLVLMVAIVILAAGLLELAQHLVPNRHGLLADFVAKAAGGALGVLVVGVVVRALNFD
jgi:VanZ family protein